LASLLAGGGEYEGRERWLEGFNDGLTQGRNSGGEMRNKAQWMVECSAIGFAIAVAEEKLWEPLSDDETKKNLEDCLGGMNDKGRIKIGCGSRYEFFGQVNVYQTDTFILCKFLPILGFPGPVLLDLTQHV
jgi:hypothetical protein